MTPHWVQLIGRLHPVVIHFPIALMLVACLCEVLHLTTRKRFFHSAAELNLALAILGTIVAIVLGWILAATTHDVSADLRWIVPWHRWLGVAALAAGIGAFVVLHLSRLHSQRWIWLYWGLLALSAALIGITGHLGGELVYGSDYLN
ncbi:MAG TPA: DUF2231 domain-containing protein [Chthoniobacterales bacterium]